MALERPRPLRARHAYSTDLSDERWALLEPILNGLAVDVGAAWPGNPCPARPLATLLFFCPLGWAVMVEGLRVPVLVPLLAAREAGTPIVVPSPRALSGSLRRPAVTGTLSVALPVAARVITIPTARNSCWFSRRMGAQRDGRVDRGRIGRGQAHRASGTDRDESGAGCSGALEQRRGHRLPYLPVVVLS